MSQTVSRLWPLVRPVIGWLLLSVLLGAIAMAANIALLATSGWFITAMAAAGLAGVSMNYFTPGALIRGFSIARTAGRYAERVVGHEATLRLVALARPWLFRRLLPLAPAALGDLASGDLLTRLKGDIDRLELAFLRVAAPAAVAVLVLVPGVIIVAWIDLATGLAVMALVMIAALAIPYRLYRISQRRSARLASQAAEWNARLIDHVSGLGELAIHDPSQRHLAVTLADGDALLADERSLAMAGAAANAGIGLTANLALVAALILGLSAYSSGALSAPQVPMLGLLALALFEAVGPLPAAMQALPAIHASIARIWGLVERQPIDPDPETPVVAPDRAMIQFEDVGLTYAGTDHAVLTGLSFQIRPGERIALVGPSGTGKSSVIALLLRFVLPTTGTIRVGKMALADLAGDAWRRRIALLPQGATLFSASIRENLRLAKPDATDSEMLAALELAGAGTMLEAMPEGLSTFIGPHGATVSGGEARRIALARALLKPASMLVLDEPTEGLDTFMSMNILESIVASRPDQTIVLVTHDTALLNLCDREVVFGAAGSPTVKAVDRNQT